MPRTKKLEEEKTTEEAGAVEEKKEIKEKKPKSKKAKEKAEESEAESVGLKEKTSDRSVLLREKIKERAKKIAAEKVETIGTEEIKEEFEKKRETRVPLEDYVKTGIHLGTRVITPDMRKFVYRRRADSIGVLNTTLIDDQIKKAIEIVAKYSPKEIILVCKREAGWKAAHLFSETTGIKVFTKKYPAGMMTNIKLETFYEPELVIVCDPWIDRNALEDAIKTNKKRIVLSDTNNFTKDANFVIPCNNKGAKSLGLVFYLIAKGYIEKRKLEATLPEMDKFTDESQD